MKLPFLLSSFLFCDNEKKEYLPNIINMINVTVPWRLNDTFVASSCFESNHEVLVLKVFNILVV